MFKVHAGSVEENSPAPISRPVLGLALQKNYVSLYTSAYLDESPFTFTFTCAYAGRLGRPGSAAKAS